MASSASSPPASRTGDGVPERKGAGAPASVAIRVLLIEDDFQLVELLSQLLSGNRSAKFSVRATNCLQQGLRAAARGAFDAMVLDLTLPDSVGAETFRRVRADVPDLPVIILSGIDDEELAVKLVHEGAQDYFIKGEGDIHLLPRAIRYAIQRHRIEQALEAERNLLLNVLNSLPDVVYVRDREGCYAIANTAHARFLGAQESGDVVGRTPFDFLATEAATALDADDHRIMKSRAPVSDYFEFVGEEAGHSARWFSTSKVPLLDAAGEVIGLVGCFREITEQKEAEETLRVSDQQQRALARQLQEAR